MLETREGSGFVERLESYKHCHGGIGMESLSNRKTICLILIIVSAALWVTAPFVAINLLTIGEQPTALQLITDDVTYIGELSESPAFWAAVISLAGIVVCFICIVMGKLYATRIIAIITEIPLMWSLVDTIMWAKNEGEKIYYINGFGFWGILLLLIVVIAFAKNNKLEATTTSSDNSEKMEL